MAAQTEYTIKQDVAYAGLIYALHPHDINSFLVEDSDGIEFGVAVSRGTDVDRQVTKGGSDFVGITVRSLEREGANTGAIQYEEKEAAGVMAAGYIWAVCPTGCNPGDAVKYDGTTGELDAGTAGAGEWQLDEAEWWTTASAGDLAVIRLADKDATAGS